MTETGLIHVFAYGSNLCTRRIAARVDDLQLVCVGSIAGYALRFNKRSRDGSAKANAHRTAVIDDVVWGAVYGMDAVNKKRLDSFEGLGQDYFESEVAVQTTAGASIAALFYWANPEHVDEGGAPYDWYHRFCLEGAREHGFPQDYLCRLANTRVIPDPDRGRHARESAILDSIYGL